jgi:hypothetical protein
LSESASPALGPCGIPDELEEVDVLGAAPPELPDEVVGDDDDLLVVLELEEFEPQADAARAAAASRTAVLQRIERLLAMCMNGSLFTA